MNRIYRLVWNRALHVLQVGSELARPHGGIAGGATASMPRKRPLAQACAIALALGASLYIAAPRASAQSVVGGQGGASTYAGTGGASGNGGNSSAYPGFSSNQGNGGTGGGGAGGGAVGGTYSSSTTLSSNLAGGNGNGGGTDGAALGYGGGGGGAGAYLSGAGPLFAVSSGITVQGGNGGSGGSDTAAGGGGGGGNGIAAGSSFTINNAGGTISGGDGGAGGSGTGGGGGGGGDGIAGAGISINAFSGTISGGRGGAGGGAGADAGSNGDAILFSGGGNALVWGGGAINGAVEVTNGATATITADAGGLNLSGGTLGNSALIVNGATTINTNGQAFSVSGTITGSASLTTNGDGALTLGTVSVGSLSDSDATTLDGNVTTTGAQTYDSAVTLGSGITLTSSNGDAVDLASTVDGAHSLTVNTGGAVTFGGTVGGTTALTGLTVNSGSFITNADVFVNGSLSATTSAGSILQSAGVFAVSGTSNFNAGNNAVTLTSAGNNFAGEVTAAGSNVAITNSIALNIASVTTTGGMGNIDLTSSDNLTLAGNVSGGTVTLVADGNIDQTGGILTATTLSGSSTGSTTMNSANAITHLANFSAADFNLTDVTALTIAGNLAAQEIALNDANGIVVTGSVATSGAGTTIGGDTTLQIGNGGSNGSISGNVIAQGTLAFDRNDVVDFGGTISGDGSVVVTGTNTSVLTLDTANSYTGGTSINNGTVVVDTSGVFGSGPVTINSNGNRNNSLAIAFYDSSAGDLHYTNAGIGIMSFSQGSTAGNAIIDNSGDAAETDFQVGTDAGNATITNSGISSSVQFFGGDAAHATIFNNGDGQRYTASTVFSDGLSSPSEIATAGDATITNSNGGATYLEGHSDAGTATLINQAGGLIQFWQSSTGDNATVQNGAGGVVEVFARDTGQLNVGIGSLSGNGNVVLDTSGDGSGTPVSLTLGNLNQNDTIGGVISDANGQGGSYGDALTKIGSGTLTLNGVNTYTGTTTVASGTLLVGDSANADASIAGDVSVDSGATLSGHGTVGGNVDVASGAHLSPGGGIGTLTVNGNLAVAQGGILDYEFGAPGGTSTADTGDKVSVGGDLTLNGATLNVTADGGFGVGLYNVFSYNGALAETNGGIALGTVPAGDTLSIQTLTGTKQINLINATGLTLNYWNANGQASSTQMGGSSGTWTTSSSNWADANGDVTDVMSPQPGFAIFGGTPGTVTVDNSAGAVSATGLQFATSGYLMNGDTLTLVADSSGSAPTIRMGNGSTAGASDVAEIDNVLTGTAGLNKADYGTLVLAGNNTYTGGTTISTGTLQLGNGGTSGSVQGDIADNGTLVFDRSDAVAFDGMITGTGSLTQAGTGTLTLSNAATRYSGLTTINNGGALALIGDASIAGSSSVVDNGTFDISKTNSGVSITSLSGTGAVMLGNQSLTLSNAHDTFSGAINGSGGLTLNGGTQVLTGNNTYSGATTINGGYLAGSATSFGTGTIADNAQLGLLQQTDGTLANTITGNGSLAIIGKATVTLTGTNTYSGGTTISTGTLQLGNGSTTGSITGDVTDNGTLAFNRSDDVSFDGVVSGSGGVSKSGSNALTLTGSNSYSGGTALNAGTLTLGNASSIGTGTLAMAAGSTLNFAIAFTLTNAISLSGDPTINVGAGVITTLSGGISDSTSSGDLVKTGSGTLALTGADTYTGNTAVTAGTLDIEGSVDSAVSVDNGATLIGKGSVGGMTISSGATVSPGSNSVGTLTVNGNVGIAAGSTYQLDVTDTGSSDLIHATGMATLGGGSVVSTEAGGNWNATTKYTILTADGGVNGTFGSVSSNFAFLNPVLSYDARDAYLTLSRNAITFPSVGVTPNEIHTGAGIEALGVGNAVYDAVLPLSAADARSAFNQLAGDSLASTRTAMIDDSHYVRDAINNHLQGVQGTGETGQSTDQGSVWANTWGHGGNHDSDGNAARMGSNGSGLLVGTDRDLDTWRVGAVAGTGQLSNNTTYGAADAHSTDTVFGLYTGLDLGAWQLQGGAAHSWYETRSHRQINIPGFESRATASYNTGLTQAYVDGGYRFTFGQSSLTPYANLARVWVHQNAIDEGGNVGALDVQANGSSVNYGTVGLRGIYEPSHGLQLYANAGFQKAWGDLRSIDQQTFANGGADSFTVAGLPVSNNTGTFDLGIRFAISQNVSVDASYHGQFGSDSTDQGARMALNVAF